jgi:hypothetical protein
MCVGPSVAGGTEQWQLLRLECDLHMIAELCLNSNIKECKANLHDFMLDVYVKHSMQANYAARSALTLTISDKFRLVSFHYWIVISEDLAYIWYLGAAAYDELYGGWTVADLNQDARRRPKYGVTHMPCLTTGCSHIWLKTAGRYIHRSELLVLQGLPVTLQLAKAWKCSQVSVAQISHRAKAFLAGNMMHATSVGFMACMQRQLALWPL